MSIDGSDSGYSMPRVPLSNADLVGSEVLCAGYGRYSEETGTSGTLRWAHMNLCQMDPYSVHEAPYYEINMLKFVDNDLDQFLYSGDSGASCFYLLGDRWYLANVHHASEKQIENRFGMESGPDTMEPWVSSVLDELTPRLTDDYSQYNFNVAIEPVASEPLVVNRADVAIPVPDPSLPFAYDLSFNAEAVARAGLSQVLWELYREDAQTGELTR